MTVVLALAGFLLVIVWVLTLVDIFRHDFPRTKMWAWILIVVLVPFLGAIAYWIVRDPGAGEADRAYLDESEARRDRARSSGRGFDFRK